MMPENPLRTLDWQEQCVAMRQCASTDEIVERFGPPDHKVVQGGMEIWHYPLGVHNGILHSIHVAVLSGKKPQVYSFTEPARQS